MKKLIALLMALSMALVPAGTVFAEDGAADVIVLEEDEAAEGEASEEIPGVEETVEEAEEVLPEADEVVEVISEAEAVPEEVPQTEAAADPLADGIILDDYEYEDIFAAWNPDAPALNTLIDYVESVTDENSADYIPPVDRIAIFDMDGTLYGELFPTYLEYYVLAWRILKDPSIEPDTEMLNVGRTLRDCALDKSFPEDMTMQHALQAARAYAGMTLNEFSDFITEILLRDVDGFEGMTYGEAFYEPMIEVIDYLNENDFKVYVCSGTDRFLCRTLLEGMVDVPAEHIIGMDVALEATNQGDEDPLDYVYQAEDEVVRTDRLLIKNLKMNKVLQIAREIGRQPVLSFGNSSGDTSMHNYVLDSNRYKSAAFMLIADDEERDYGNTEKTRELGKTWEESGYNVISMKDDFLTIYGDDVIKTGSFRWMEELAEDRIPSDLEEKGAGVTGMIDSILEEGGKLLGLLGSIFSGGDDGDEADTTAEDGEEENPHSHFIMLDDEAYEASENAVLEINKEFLEAGDAQLVTCCVAKNAVIDDVTVQQLGMFTQQNFVVEGGDMKLVGAARDVFLFTHTKNEDGTYSMTNYEKSTDGEDYQASVAAMCGEMGVTEEEFSEATRDMEYWDVEQMLIYANQHPEIERIEYAAEMFTVDELTAMRDEMMAELYG